MELPPNPDLAREIAAALDWWREAGVDLAFADVASPLVSLEPSTPPPEKAEPAQRTPARPAPQPVATPASAVDLSAMPGDLDAFRAWWLTEPTLDGGRVHNRVSPRGPEGADILVLVGDPENADDDMLLSGPQGKLAASFLTAAGINPVNAYFASVLPRCTPHADWQAMAAAGFGTVLARHIALVRPKRIIAFDGNNLPLADNVWPNTPESLRHFHHEGASIPLLAARGLPALLNRASWRAGLWQGWLDWTRGD